MHDDNGEDSGLIDNDPALDCILFEEIRKEDSQQKRRGGCFGILAFFLIPACYFVIHLTVI